MLVVLRFMIMLVINLDKDSILETTQFIPFLQKRMAIYRFVGISCQRVLLVGLRRAMLKLLQLVLEESYPTMLLGHKKRDKSLLSDLLTEQFLHPLPRVIAC